MRRPPPAIHLEEAISLLRSKVPAPAVERATLAEVAGRVLAADIASDMDMPPFDRAMMDGFAVAASDTPGALEIVEDIPAGKVGTKKVGGGSCARIMTGAPVPAGADAVEQVEKVAVTGTRVQVGQVAPGLNIARKAGDIARGQKVLSKGTRVGPAQLAVLAAAGAVDISVYRRPRLAMFATGDELVDPSRPPAPGQIRNSNGFSVPAQARAAGFECDPLGHARDEVDAIRALVRAGLERDVLLISGGVSAGDWDLVVPALEAEGVSTEMHQVLIRPGRPFFFGRKQQRVVFGLPGNPVSSFVTFEVFVRPFLGWMMGTTNLERPRVRLKLAAALPQKADRVQFIPAMIEGDRVRTLPWKGSADIWTLSRAEALAIQPSLTALAEGADIEVMLL